MKGWRKGGGLLSLPKHRAVVVLGGPLLSCYTRWHNNFFPVLIKSEFSADLSCFLLRVRPGINGLFKNHFQKIKIGT